MRESWKGTWVIAGTVLGLLGPAPSRAASLDAASVLSRVAAVTARSPRPDGSLVEEIGNCRPWATGERTYTLADLHTVMAGEEGASDRVAEEIVVAVGKRSSRARLAWPPEGRRNVLEVDVAILELDAAIVGGQPFAPDDFQGALSDLPRFLYLAAPGHRSRILSILAPAVRYGSQWFLYRELAHGDSGGMVFALQDGRVVPYGFVSAVGSLPGASARGTAVYGRDAMRFFIDQFLRARARVASTP